MAKNDVNIQALLAQNLQHLASPHMAAHKVLSKISAIEDKRSLV
jgi:hypothetical protein